MSDDELNTDFLNETLAVLSDEDDTADLTLNQSADSLFRSFGSNLLVPSSRTICSPANRKGKKTGKVKGKSKGDCNTYPCHFCSSRLKTKKGLRNHLLNHRLAEAGSRKPSPECLEQQCIRDGAQISLDILKAAMSKIITGDKFSLFAERISDCATPEPSIAFCEFVKACVRPLIQPVCSSKSVDPSSLRKLVREHLHKSLAVSEVRNERLTILISLVDSENCQAEAELYLSEYCRRLIITTVTFLLSLMRDNPDDPHVLMSSKFSKDDFVSLFSQQTLHNILGATVKGVLRRTRQFKGNPKWDAIQKVLLHRFAYIGVMEARPHETSFWTALLGRKSYTFVSESVLQFFVEVAKILCYVETRSGSIPIEEVLEKVSSSPMLVSQWFSIVGSGLNELDAIFLMRLMITSLCRTFGRGTLLRRTNLEADRRKRSSGGVTSAGLRAQLAR